MKDSRTSTPTVSVVIPVRGSIELLDSQLQALATQDYQGCLETIVSDNGGSSELAHHAATHSLRDRLNLRYVDSSAVPGPAHARNRGAEEAFGVFLAFCDADDVVHESWITALISLAQHHDVVGTAVETSTINSTKARAWTPDLPPERQGKTSFLPFAIGASLGCCADVYRDLGGMDTDFTASEDVEFSWRAQLAGYSLGFSEQQLVAYRLRDEFRPLVKQAYNLGYGFAKLQGLHRERGCPPVDIKRVLFFWTLLLLGNPLVPSRITKISRGHWARSVAAHTGEVVGGLEFHTFGWPRSRPNSVESTMSTAWSRIRSARARRPTHAFGIHPRHKSADQDAHRSQSG
ncbi:MAG: glycosyltransferase [Rhodococcus sp. (in: high G+C Gram-positive bacteria)]